MWKHGKSAMCLQQGSNLGTLSQTSAQTNNWKSESSHAKYQTEDAMVIGTTIETQRFNGEQMKIQNAWQETRTRYLEVKNALKLNWKTQALRIERAPCQSLSNAKRCVFDKNQETLAHSNGGGGRWFPPSSPAVPAAAIQKKFQKMENHTSLERSHHQDLKYTNGLT